MKTPLILVVGILLAGAQCSHAVEVAPAVAAIEGQVATTMTAAQVLEKSRATYAGFAVYKGSCSVVFDIVSAEGDAAPTQSVLSASARIEFERDARLALQGVGFGGGFYKAQWTPGETWLETMEGREQEGDVGELKREILVDEPDFSAREGLIASLNIPTGGTGSRVPNALAPDEFDLGNPFTLLGTAKMLPARNLGDVPCYVIEATMPELNRVMTYWIEQKTFLLRRLTEEVGEQRFDDMPEVDGVKLPTSRVVYMSSQFVFATTEAK